MIPQKGWGSCTVIAFIWQATGESWQPAMTFLITYLCCWTKTLWTHNCEVSVFVRGLHEESEFFFIWSFTTRNLKGRNKFAFCHLAYNEALILWSSKEHYLLGQWHIGSALDRNQFCTSNLSSDKALKQDFAIAKMGSKHLMMNILNILAAVHSALYFSFAVIVSEINPSDHKSISGCLFS